MQIIQSSRDKGVQFRVTNLVKILLKSSVQQNELGFKIAVFGPETQDLLGTYANL